MTRSAQDALHDGPSAPENDFSDVLVPYESTVAASAEGTATFRRNVANARLLDVCAKASIIGVAALFAMSCFSLFLVDFDLSVANRLLFAIFILVKLCCVGFGYFFSGAIRLRRRAALALGGCVPVVDAVVFWIVYCRGARRLADALDEVDGNRMQFQGAFPHAVAVFALGVATVCLYLLGGLLVAYESGELYLGYVDVEVFSLAFYMPFILLSGLLGGVGRVGVVVLAIGYCFALAFFVARSYLIWRCAVAARYVYEATRFDDEPHATREERAESRRRRDALLNDASDRQTQEVCEEEVKRVEEGSEPTNQGRDELPIELDAQPRRPTIPSWRRD